MKPIAAVQGGSNRAIQALMMACATGWSLEGPKVAALVEVFDDLAPQVRGSARLQNLKTGDTYPLFQNLGPLAAACHLDAAGVMAACALVCRQIDEGCDLVVLSKFGQLEASRSGLIGAFAAAVDKGIPILTAVSPAYQENWDAFAAPLGMVLPPHRQALDHWWRAVRTGRQGVLSRLIAE